MGQKGAIIEWFESTVFYADDVDLIRDDIDTLQSNTDVLVEAR